MTSTVDVVNRALQLLGTRTTVTQQELQNGTSNEALQVALVLNSTRDQLSRMAPWNSCDAVINLSYISSVPGTPENTSPAVNGWIRGLPQPPWAYEYAYPPDCLRALRVMSWTETGVTNYPSGIPVFGNVANYPPIYADRPPKFKIGTDRFYPVTAAAVVTGGTGHRVGDIITSAYAGPGQVPVGSPVQLMVTGLVGAAPSGVKTVEVLLGDYDFNDTDTGDDFGPDNNTDIPALSAGGYFVPLTAPQGQSSTTGTGTGATFALTYGPRVTRRVLLTNQPRATLKYVQRMTDPSVMDPLFIEAWINLIAMQLALALTGDKAMANLRIQTANKAISEARAIDGNEGFDVHNIMPDWLAVRGVGDDGPYSDGYDWGPLWPTV